MHWHLANADRSIVLEVDEDSSNGRVWGNIEFEGVSYPVNGLWTASGSITGRNVSNIHVSGSAPSPSAAGAPNFLAASGQISFNGGAPNITGIDIGLYVSSSFSGSLDQRIDRLTPA